MNEPRNLPPVVLHGIVRPSNRPRYFPGKGCMCSANSEAECCCEGVDWRSREEHRLREILEDIKADYEFCKDKPGFGDRGAAYYETVCAALGANPGADRTAHGTGDKA